MWPFLFFLMVQLMTPTYCWEELVCEDGYCTIVIRCTVEEIEEIDGEADPPYDKRGFLPQKYVP